MLTKKDQTKSNRLKKPYCGKNKNRKGSKKVSSLSMNDKKYLSWLQTTSYACFACGGDNGIEWHHVKRDSTDKKNHTRLIPLCGVECHRLGTVLSAHGTPKKFRETFSMEFQNEYADRIYSEYKETML